MQNHPLPYHNSNENYLLALAKKWWNAFWSTTPKKIVFHDDATGEKITYTYKK